MLFVDLERETTRSMRLRVPTVAGVDARERVADPSPTPVPCANGTTFGAKGEITGSALLAVVTLRRAGEGND